LVSADNLEEALWPWTGPEAKAAERLAGEGLPWRQAAERALIAAAERHWRVGGTED